MSVFILVENLIIYVDKTLHFFSLEEMGAGESLQHLCFIPRGLETSITE